MKHAVSISVNGVARQDEIEPRTLLVQYLRDSAGQTGVHIGCDTSECGACTVMLDGEAVKSCNVFAVQADGCQVDTIESLADGDRLHPIQQAFADHHGLQCGYCTPGFVMATLDLLARNPRPSDEEIKEGLEGNLCRCTGYVNIVRAVRAAAEALAGAAPGTAA